MPSSTQSSRKQGSATIKQVPLTKSLRSTKSSSPIPDASCEVEHHPGPYFPRGTRVLLCGSFFPTSNRRTMPFFYPNLQNDMWRVMGILFYGNANHFLLKSSDAPHDCAASGKARVCWNQNQIEAFLREHHIGVCDVAKSIQRHAGRSSDDNLHILEAFDFVNDILPRVPECEAIITTGTLALRTLLEQRQRTLLINGDAEAKKRGRSCSTTMIPIGEHFAWVLPVANVLPGAPCSMRTIHVYRAPSTSRAYPRPLAEKVALYRTILSSYFPI